MKLSVPEAASLLATSDDQVYDWIEDASLPARRIRGKYHINPTELLEWATEHDIVIAPRAFNRPGDAPGIPSVADALRAGGVHYDVPGSDTVAALRAIVSDLPLADESDRETLLQFILPRQGLGMSVAAEGIAIPSVRVPTVLSATESVLMLSFLAKPLTLNFPEPRLIHTMFFLVCPTVHAHLAMVAKLAYCLRDDAFRGAILRRAPLDEILRAAAAAEEETTTA
jgi:PTS system nitrogen regulatory IIA component